MSRRRHTPEQIITALREAEVGLARGKTVRSEKRMDYRNKKSGFDLLDYQATDLELIWTDVQVAY